jgi:hypothetical protein
MSSPILDLQTINAHNHRWLLLLEYQRSLRAYQVALKNNTGSWNDPVFDYASARFWRGRHAALNAGILRWPYIRAGVWRLSPQHGWPT